MIQPDQLLVRLEQLTVHGTTRYSTQIIDRQNVASLLSRIGSTTSVHEMLTANRCRLFMDVDCDDGTSIDLLLPQLDKIVETELGQSFKRHHLRSDGNKVSAHVFYDVNVTLSHAKHIARVAQRQIPAIDCLVYRLGGSLRLMNTIKISNNVIINRKFPCGYEYVNDHFISYDDSLPFIH